MIELSLSNGGVALLDEEDLSLVKHRKWSKHKKGHAVASIGGKQVKMHRLIMGAQPDQQVDHQNGNRLDNRKENLRFATSTENSRNRHTTHGKSQYKGIYFDKNLNKWRTRLCIGGKRLYFGNYSFEIDAAKAYDKAAIELFGEFACLNFPEEQ